jgi:hypothetical protein
MPIFQRSIKTIQNADDGPGVLGSGEDTEALTWDNGTGKFVMATGGGTSDHAALSNLDYANAGHTGFAGTGVANTFTHQQTLNTPLFDAVLETDLLVNGDFATDLSDWTDGDSSWSWSTGAATHTPGAPGTLTQDVTMPGEGIYCIELSVSGMTAGQIQAYDNYWLYVTITGNGIYRTIGYVSPGTDTIVLSADSDFDGRVEYISFALVTDGTLPANLKFYDAYGILSSELRTFGGSLFMGTQAGRWNSVNDNLGYGNYTLAAIVEQHNNAAFGNGSGQSATCNGGLFLGHSSGSSETNDNKLHVGNGGDIISGTMDNGTAASQVLKFHVATIDVSDLPTSAGATGTLYVDGSGFLKRA